jgi:hypothetical protein
MAETKCRNPDCANRSAEPSLDDWFPNDEVDGWLAEPWPPGWCCLRCVSISLERALADSQEGKNITISDAQLYRYAKWIVETHPTQRERDSVFLELLMGCRGYSVKGMGRAGCIVRPARLGPFPVEPPPH